MMSAEDQAKVKAWLDSHDEDDRYAWILITKGFDEWLEKRKQENLPERKEELENVKRFAAFRYNVEVESGISLFFSLFADGFVAGFEAASKAYEAMKEEENNDERAED